MSINRQNCVRVFKTLRNSDYPIIPEQCMEALLRWLCGGQTGPAEPARRILGDPATDKRLVEKVYHSLDTILFTGDVTLRPVHGTISEKERRYRLLVRAFHPDRYPALENWLNFRSQAVNAAYAQFRNDPDAREIDERTVETNVSSPVFISKAPVYHRPSIGEQIVRVTAPLSRHIQRTIMIAVAIVCTLLFIIIYYTNRII